MVQQIITYSDFEGVYVVDLGNDTDKQALLDAYCVDLQEKYLKYLFGESLYSEFFIRDKNADDKFNELIDGTNNPITYNGTTFVYKGLKDMLLSFTYFHYVQEPEYHTQIGFVLGDSENGSITYPVDMLRRKFNYGVDLFYEAVRYMDYKNSQESEAFNYKLTPLEKINFCGI